MEDNTTDVTNPNGFIMGASEKERLEKLRNDPEFLEEFHTLKTEIIQAAARHVRSYIKNLIH